VAGVLNRIQLANQFSLVADQAFSWASQLGLLALVCSSCICLSAHLAKRDILCALSTMRMERKSCGTTSPMSFIIFILRSCPRGHPEKTTALDRNSVGVEFLFRSVEMEQVL
jgi:hypothetical protein